jgi:hypothetical protein
VSTYSVRSSRLGKLHLILGDTERRAAPALEDTSKGDREEQLARVFTPLRKPTVRGLFCYFSVLCDAMSPAASLGLTLNFCRQTTFSQLPKLQHRTGASGLSDETDFYDKRWALSCFGSLQAERGIHGSVLVLRRNGDT